MTKPDELVESVAKMLMAYDTVIINGWDVADGWEKELFKRRATEIVNKFLSEIQKGEVVEVGSNGMDKSGWLITKVELKPDYQKFMENGK